MLLKSFTIRSSPFLDLNSALNWKSAECSKKPLLYWVNTISTWSKTIWPMDVSLGMVLASRESTCTYAGQAPNSIRSEIQLTEVFRNTFQSSVVASMHFGVDLVTHRVTPVNLVWNACKSLVNLSNCVRSQNKASILEGIALFSSADTKITLERLFCEFFSVKNQIKKVLYSMSPKMAIFCSKCESRRFWDWLRLPKNDTWMGLSGDRDQPVILKYFAAARP